MGCHLFRGTALVSHGVVQVEIIEEKLKDIEDKSEKYENKSQESQTTLSHLRTGIETLFSKMQCSQEDLPPGASQDFSEENNRFFLQFKKIRNI